MTHIFSADPEDLEGEEGKLKNPVDGSQVWSNSGSIFSGLASLFSGIFSGLGSLIGSVGGAGLAFLFMPFSIGAGLLGTTLITALADALKPTQPVTICAALGKDEPFYNAGLIGNFSDDGWKLQEGQTVHTTEHTLVLWCKPFINRNNVTLPNITGDFVGTIFVAGTNYQIELIF